MERTDTPTTSNGTPEATPDPAMLIDRYLPDFDVTAIEHLVVEADLASTWQALRALDLMQVHTPLMAAAFYVRGLPERLAVRTGRTRPASPPPVRLTLDDEGPGLEGWLALGQLAPRELAFGAVGRFWQPEIEWYDVSEMTPETFGAFEEPGWGRIAANFSLRHYGEPRTLVSYEARTATPDALSARRFGRYWALVRPFVGHVMRATLTTLRDDVQRRPG